MRRHEFVSGARNYVIATARDEGAWATYIYNRSGRLLHTEKHPNGLDGHRRITDRVTRGELDPEGS